MKIVLVFEDGSTITIIDVTDISFVELSDGRAVRIFGKIYRGVSKIEITEILEPQTLQ